MSASDALTICMFSTAMNAPSVAPVTAIQVRTLEPVSGSASVVMTGLHWIFGWGDHASSAGPGECGQCGKDYSVMVEGDGLVSIVGSTDMPDRSRPDRAGSSNVI